MKKVMLAFAFCVALFGADSISDVLNDANKTAGNEVELDRDIEKIWAARVLDPNIQINVQDPFFDTGRVVLSSQATSGQKINAIVGNMVKIGDNWENLSEKELKDMKSQKGKDAVVVEDNSKKFKIEQKIRGEYK